MSTLLHEGHDSGEKIGHIPLCLDRGTVCWDGFIVRDAYQALRRSPRCYTPRRRHLIGLNIDNWFRLPRFSRTSCHIHFWLSPLLHEFNLYGAQIGHIPLFLDRGTVRQDRTLVYDACQALLRLPRCCTPSWRHLIGLIEDTWRQSPSISRPLRHVHTLWSDSIYIHYCTKVTDLSISIMTPVCQAVFLSPMFAQGSSGLTSAVGRISRVTFFPSPLRPFGVDSVYFTPISHSHLALTGWAALF